MVQFECPRVIYSLVLFTFGVIFWLSISQYAGKGKCCMWMVNEVEIQFAKIGLGLMSFTLHKIFYFIFNLDIGNFTSGMKSTFICTFMSLFTSEKPHGEQEQHEKELRSCGVSRPRHHSRHGQPETALLRCCRWTVGPSHRWAGGVTNWTSSNLLLSES